MAGPSGVGVFEQRLADARTEHKDPTWGADYRATRPKVERKIGHLMRRTHRRRRARVRGKLKVDADFNLLEMAHNLARLAVLKVHPTPGGWAVATASEHRRKAAALPQPPEAPHKPLGTPDHRVRQSTRIRFQAPQDHSARTPQNRSTQNRLINTSHLGNRGTWWRAARCPTCWSVRPEMVAVPGASGSGWQLPPATSTSGARLAIWGLRTTSRSRLWAAMKSPRRCRR